MCIQTAVIAGLQNSGICARDLKNKRALVIAEDGSLNGHFDLVKEQDIEVSGIKTKKNYRILVWDEPGAGVAERNPTHFDTDIILVKNKYYLIAADWEENDSEADKIFDQILSTLRFD